MKFSRLRGIVLSVNSHGESDKLVTLLCADLGMIRTIAKGAKRSKKRFVNKLEPFTLLDAICRPPRHGGLFFLLEAELTEAFMGLRTSHRRYITAGYLVELVLRFTREQEGDTAVFPLLLWALTELDRGFPPLRMAAIFHLRLLGLAGYQPELAFCGRCGFPVKAARTFSLEPGSGSLICSHCRRQDHLASPALSMQALRFMQGVQTVELDRIKRFQLPLGPTLEILQVLHRYTVQILQRDINSFRLLSQVQT